MLFVYNVKKHRSWLKTTNVKFSGMRFNTMDRDSLCKMIATKLRKFFCTIKHNRLVLYNVGNIVALSGKAIEIVLILPFILHNEAFNKQVFSTPSIARKGVPVC